MKLATLSVCSVLLLAASLYAGGDPYGDISDLKLLKPEDKEDMPSVPPPTGPSFSSTARASTAGSRPTARTRPGGSCSTAASCRSAGGNIITKQKFDGNFKLHVEFRVPYMPKANGQGRGNSGVYVQGRYEVQVLDSYGLKSKDNDCGGIYTVAAPLVNACKAPTIWQTYDIEFTAPVCEDGKKIAPAVMTVYQNGVKIHDAVKITKDNTTAGLGGDPCTPGPIMLQDHGNPVQFRNIWLVQMPAK